MLDAGTPLAAYSGGERRSIYSVLQHEAAGIHAFPKTLVPILDQGSEGLEVPTRTLTCCGILPRLEMSKAFHCSPETGDRTNVWILSSKSTGIALHDG